MDVVLVFVGGGLGVFLVFGLLSLSLKFGEIFRSRILPPIAKAYDRLLFHDGHIRMSVLFVCFGAVAVVLYLAGG